VDLSTFIVSVFCLIDDHLKGRRIRRRGPAPKLSDSEVLTIEVVGENGFSIFPPVRLPRAVHRLWYRVAPPPVESASPEPAFLIYCGHGLYAHQLEPQSAYAIEDAMEVGLVDDLSCQDRMPCLMGWLGRLGRSQATSPRTGWRASSRRSSGKGR
jgi:hypothetical protein